MQKQERGLITVMGGGVDHPPIHLVTPRLLVVLPLTYLLQIKQIIGEVYSLSVFSEHRRTQSTINLLNIRFILVGRRGFPNSTEWGFHVHKGFPVGIS